MQSYFDISILMEINIVKKNMRTATAVDAFVGAQLKGLRKSAGLSQTELANQIGVTFQQVQKYERGTNRIGASRLWGLCKVLDVKPDRFFEGVETHLAQLPETPTPDFANDDTVPSAQPSESGYSQESQRRASN